MDELLVPISPDYAIDSAKAKNSQFLWAEACRALPVGSEMDRKKLADALVQFASHGLIENFSFFLQKYLKTPEIEQTVSNKEYLLQLDMVPVGGVYFGVKHRKSYDARYNLFLLRILDVIASLSFNIGSGQFVIKQIQGVLDKQKDLEPFHWKDALVDYLSQFAKVNQVPRIKIVSALNNTSAKDSFEYLVEQGVYPKGMHIMDAALLSHSQAKKYIEKAKQLGIDVKGDHIFWPHLAYRNYDTVAERCGFRRDHDSNYVKPLQD